MTLRNARRSGEIAFTGCHTIDYRGEFSTTNLEESGI
jgi:hypothetical protein